MAEPKLTESKMQCAKCKEYFSGLTNFDKHLVWDDPKAWNRHRVCLDPREVGLEQRGDVFWRGPVLSEAQKEKMGWG